MNDFEKQKNLEIFLAFTDNLQKVVQEVESSLSKEQISDHVKVCLELGGKFKFQVIPLSWYDSEKDLLVSLFKFRDSIITFETSKEVNKNENSRINAFYYLYDPMHQKKGKTKLDYLCCAEQGPDFKQYIH